MAAEDPKSVAASILGPEPMDAGAASLMESESPEEDSESAALGLMADEALAAMAANDREGLVEVFRSLMLMARNGGV